MASPPVPPTEVGDSHGQQVTPPETVTEDMDDPNVAMTVREEVDNSHGQQDTPLQGRNEFVDGFNRTLMTPDRFNEIREALRTCTTDQKPDLVPDEGVVKFVRFFNIKRNYAKPKRTGVMFKQFLSFQLLNGYHILRYMLIQEDFSKDGEEVQQDAPQIEQ